MKDIPKTWVLAENHFQISERRRTKSRLLILQNNPVEQKHLQNCKIQGSCSQETKIKELANSFHIQTVGTIARPDRKSQTLTSSSLCILGWSKHGH